MEIKQAISRLKAHKNHHVAEHFIHESTINKALDAAIAALEEKAEREERIKKYSAEIVPHKKRHATAYAGEYKGKYGVEYIATIYYEILEEFIYIDAPPTASLFYPCRVLHVKASNMHRLIKKVAKVVERLDAEIIASEKGF